MKKIILIIILLTTLATSSFAQNVDEDYPGNKPGDNLFQNTFFTKEVETKNYLVISGFAKHFSNAPNVIGKWNEENYGIGYQRSFKEKDSLYRYSLEGGFFKESFGKTATYVAGAILRDITTEPRISVGGMLGLAYRINRVKDAYYSQPIYGPVKPNHTPIAVYIKKEITPMGGLIAQFEIPKTSAVIQTTYLPKIAGNASAVLFTQLLVNF